MAKHFVSVWILYWAVVALLPVHSIYPATAAAFALQFTFVALVLTAYVVTQVTLGTQALPPAGRFDLRSAPTLVRIALGMSVIGFCCLTYDKIYIQGIDYSQGLAAAREAWRRLGEERDGSVSSIFSVLGYLLGSGYFVAAVLAVTQIATLSPRQRVRALLASFALLIVNSAVTGGRSSVLLLAVFVLGAMTARSGLTWRRLYESRARRRAVLLAVGVAAAYTVFIFYQRAEASEVTAQEYALDFLPFLGLQADDWFQNLLDGSTASSLSAMLVLTVSYVTHSFATVAAIVDAPSGNKTILFVSIGGLLSKLGLMNPPTGEWFLSGRFPSVPGALWYQFGEAGFVAGSLLLGVVSAIARTWTTLQPTRLLPLGVYVMLYSVLLLSPALLSVDFLSFPFVVAAFVLLSLMDGYLRSRRLSDRLPRPPYVKSNR